MTTEAFASAFRYKRTKPFSVIRNVSRDLEPQGACGHKTPRRFLQQPTRIIQPRIPQPVPHGITPPRQFAIRQAGEIGGREGVGHFCSSAKTDTSNAVCRYW